MFSINKSDLTFWHYLLLLPYLLLPHYSAGACSIPGRSASAETTGTSCRRTSGSPVNNSANQATRARASRGAHGPHRASLHPPVFHGPDVGGHQSWARDQPRLMQPCRRPPTLRPGPDQGAPFAAVFRIEGRSLTFITALLNQQTTPVCEVRSMGLSSQHG